MSAVDRIKSNKYGAYPCSNQLIDVSCQSAEKRANGEYNIRKEERRLSPKDIAEFTIESLEGS